MSEAKNQKKLANPPVPAAEAEAEAAAEAEAEAEAEAKPATPKHQAPDSHQPVAFPLHDAVRAGDVAAVQRLLTAGVDVNAKDKSGNTALYLAATGRPDILLLLLAHGADVNARNGEDGYTALQVAAAFGEIVSINHLLEHRADRELTNHRGRTVAFFAKNEAIRNFIEQYVETPAVVAGAKSIEAARSLLDAGADVHVQNAPGSSALDIAVAPVEAGAVGSVQQLLAAGAVPVGNVQQSPAASAVPERKEQKQEAPDPERQRREAELYRAAASGNAERVRELLRQGVDVNARDERERWTPLQKAANKGHEQIVKLLLDAKADTEVHTEFMGSPDKTALHLAAQQGHAAVIKMLLDGGAQINAVDASGKTMPLHEAVAANHVESIDLLLTRGADVNARDNCGFTVLHGAASRVPALRWFDEYVLTKMMGVDVNPEEIKHSAALRQSNAEALIRNLFAHGVDPEVRNDEGRMAISYANNDAIRSLIERLTQLRQTQLDPTLVAVESCLREVKGAGGNPAFPGAGIRHNRSRASVAEDKRTILKIIMDYLARDVAVAVREHPIVVRGDLMGFASFSPALQAIRDRVCEAYGRLPAYLSVSLWPQVSNWFSATGALLREMLPTWMPGEAAGAALVQEIRDQVIEAYGRLPIYQLVELWLQIDDWLNRGVVPAWMGGEVEPRADAILVDDDQPEQQQEQTQRLPESAAQPTDDVPEPAPAAAEASAAVLPRPPASSLAVLAALEREKRRKVAEHPASAPGVAAAESDAESEQDEESDAEDGAEHGGDWYRPS